MLEHAPEAEPAPDDPLIAMMEPANLRNGDDPATWWGFHDSGLGTVVVERLVWPRGVVQPCFMVPHLAMCLRT